MWGEIYDFKQNQATVHDQHNVDALTYLREFFIKSIMVDKVQILNQELPTGTNRFTAGPEAMRFMFTDELADAVRLFSDLRIAAGPMFYRPESGNTNPAWVGGWGLGIPVGIKSPEASWKLIHY